jgi:hypothetical protein
VLGLDKRSRLVFGDKPSESKQLSWIQRAIVVGILHIGCAIALLLVVWISVVRTHRDVVLLVVPIENGFSNRILDHDLLSGLGGTFGALNALHSCCR